MDVIPKKFKKHSCPAATPRILTGSLLGDRTSHGLIGEQSIDSKFNTDSFSFITLLKKYIRTKRLIQIEFFMIEDMFTNIFTKIFTITQHSALTKMRGKFSKRF